MRKKKVASSADPIAQIESTFLCLFSKNPIPYSILFFTLLLILSLHHFLPLISSLDFLFTHQSLRILDQNESATFSSSFFISFPLSLSCDSYSFIINTSSAQMIQIGQERGFTIESPIQARNSTFVSFILSL